MYALHLHLHPAAHCMARAVVSSRPLWMWALPDCCISQGSSRSSPSSSSSSRQAAQAPELVQQPCSTFSRYHSLLQTSRPNCFQSFIVAMHCLCEHTTTGPTVRPTAKPCLQTHSCCCAGRLCMQMESTRCADKARRCLDVPHTPMPG